jgi:AraC-like DNA-binding protein
MNTQRAAIQTEPLPAALIANIEHWTRGREEFQTPIPQVSFHRQQGPTKPSECLVEPTFGLVVQGAKRMTQGGVAYNYDANRFLVTSLDLPATVQVMEASADTPYLGIAVKLDLRMMTELLVQVPPRPREQVSDRGLVVGAMTPGLAQALDRMVALLDEPQALEVLAPLVLREFHFRLLMSDQGARLRQIASVGTQGYRISRAIRWLRDHYAQPMRVEDLAAQVQMSASSFNQHFKQLTAMSPLQYQKWVRLNEARRLMLSERLDAASASFRVGYESATQFSREYGRQFGRPPRRDIEELRKESFAMAGA